ncbi:MAG TPA: NADAR family protein [Cellvibrio sp.]|nr:NADAR family protein [Cellvibrio sp.]
MSIHSIESLQKFIDQGGKPEYVFFWGHRQSGSNITKSCFSQWFPAGFVVDSVQYKSAEHFMMAEKAKLFGDSDIHQKIIEAETPDEAKSLGRKVKGFLSDIWDEKRFDIVVKGNLAKFSQNEPLKNYLLSTGSKILVEASPVDGIWGIGLAEADERVKSPTLWQGLNLLGFALMKTRDQIKTII